MEIYNIVCNFCFKDVKILSLASNKINFHKLYEVDLRHAILEYLLTFLKIKKLNDSKHLLKILLVLYFLDENISL